MSEHGEPGHGKSRSAFSLMAIGLIMPVIYVLGLGPAIYIHKRSPGPVQTSLEVVYGPLEWAFEYVPDWIEAPYGMYLELFDR